MYLVLDRQDRQSGVIIFPVPVPKGGTILTFYSRTSLCNEAYRPCT